MRLLRDDLHKKFPDGEFFFTPANITNQILDFGLPAPIDVQVIGKPAPGGPSNYELAKSIEKQIAAIPGAVDVHIHQQVSYPTMQIAVDRTKARQIGLTQQDVAQSTLISLTGTGQTQPNEWLNPVNGVNYAIVTQTPIYRIDSPQALAQTPVTTPAGNASQQLGNLAAFSRSSSPIIVDHYNIQNVYDIYADVDQRDLGGVAGEIQNIIDKATQKLPKTTQIVVRGEVQTMNESFLRLGVGIVFAILLVYMLMAVNFQSWLDPLIILMAIPCAFCGILWMLFLTQTTFSVPSLMGAIMTIGVATANSILMVVFANDERLAGKDRREAALNAGSYASAACDDDSAGDDYRYAADGTGVWRGRRAERSAGPRCDRRVVVCDAGYSVPGADDLFPAKEASAGGLLQEIHEEEHEGISNQGTPEPGTV